MNEARRIANAVRGTDRRHLQALTVITGHLDGTVSLADMDIPTRAKNALKRHAKGNQKRRYKEWQD
jgi:hypothetical protein